MLLVVHCQLAKDKMLQCNTEWVWPECILHISYAFVISDEEFSSFLLRQQHESVRRDQGERKWKWLLSPAPRFFISGEFSLWSCWQLVWKDQRGFMKNLQLEPRQHGGYCGRPEETTSLSNACFSVVRKTFRRQTKSLCVGKSMAVMSWDAFAASLMREDVI